MFPSLPTLQALQRFLPHHYCSWQLHPLSCPLSTCPHSHSWTSTFLGRISLPPRGCRTFQELAGSLPIPDITAECRVLSGSIASFGCPKTITTDQGRQFESQFFHGLAQMCAIHLSRTTPHHPAANGFVEWLHRTLKDVIMCHAEEQWTEAVISPPPHTHRIWNHPDRARLWRALAGPRQAHRISRPKVEATTFIQKLRRRMDQLRLTTAARHASPATFIHKDLRDSTHGFLRHDATRRAFEPPYSGPHKESARTDRTLTIVVGGRQVNVCVPSTGSLHIGRAQHDTSSPPAQPCIDPPNPVTTTTRPSKTTRLGRNVRFPARNTTQTLFSAGVGVMWGHPYCIFLRASRTALFPALTSNNLRGTNRMGRHYSLSGGYPRYTTHLVTSHRLVQEENCSKDGYVRPPPELE